MSPVLAQILCAVILGVSVFTATYTIAINRDSLIAQMLRRYMAYIDAERAAMLAEKNASIIVSAQGFVLAVVLGICTIVGFELYVLMGAFLCLFAPILLLTHERSQRIEKIESNMNTFMVSLANALKTTPNVPAALQRVQDVVSGPLKDEIAFTIKELRLGTTTEQALMNLSARVGLQTMDSAVGAVLIGRQVGGPLPKILETTASTYREINRLHGVMRSKTAESKGQLWVMAVAPLIIVGAFEWLKPGFFNPLGESALGLTLTGVAVLFWAGSIILSHRILSIEF